MSGTDALAVMNSRNDGYGYGDGMYGGWFWIIIILFAFGWGGNGFGNRGAEQVDIDTRFLERDIFSTNQNVSTTGCQTQRDVLENRYTTQLCCCETQKEVLENRYQNALQTQTLSSQMAQCCCDLKTAIHAEGEETRALITANTIQELRDNLQAAQLQLGNLSQTQTLLAQINKVPTPAYLTCSPYMSSFYAYNGLNGFNNGCGCGNTTII